MKIATVAFMGALVAAGAAPAFAKHHHHHHHATAAAATKSAPDASNATQNGDNTPTATGGQPGGANGRQ